MLDRGRKANDMTNENQDIVPIGGGVQDIVSCLYEIRDNLVSLHKLVSKLVYNEAESLKTPKRSERQKQTLSTAMRILEKDASRNVKRAAKKAWSANCGYSSFDSLYQSLHKHWNSRR